jgi:hypothetical protein
VAAGVGVGAAIAPEGLADGDAAGAAEQAATKRSVRIETAIGRIGSFNPVCL